MGVLSGSVSLTRYIVKGKIDAPILETVARGLEVNTISDIDDHASDKTVGWTSLDKPFQPDFGGSAFVYGNYFVFSLRIDKKKIPPKVLKKHIAIESARRIAVSGREYLSKIEKKLVKDHVVNVLSLRIPATPNIYDVIWDYNDAYLWFFSNLKAANEELETLFSKSFNLSLIRLFPYTAADLSCGLSDAQRDVLQKTSSTKFVK